jgi:hypothetical protein
MEAAADSAKERLLSLKANYYHSDLPLVNDWW